MGLADQSAATLRIGVWQKSKEPDDETDATLAALESAIQACQEQARQWRDLAAVYARYHAEICHRL